MIEALIFDMDEVLIGSALQSYLRTRTRSTVVFPIPNGPLIKIILDAAAMLRRFQVQRNIPTADQYSAKIRCAMPLIHTFLLLLYRFLHPD